MPARSPELVTLKSVTPVRIHSQGQHALVSLKPYWRLSWTIQTYTEVGYTRAITAPTHPSVLTLSNPHATTWLNYTANEHAFTASHHTKFELDSLLSKSWERTALLQQGLLGGRAGGGHLRSVSGLIVPSHSSVLLVDKFACHCTNSQ